MFIKINTTLEVIFLMSAADILPLLESIVDRLSAIEAKMGSSQSTGGSTISGVANAIVHEDVPRSIRAFDGNHYK